MFGPTRCVTLSGPQARPTGCALAGSHGEMLSMYMPRYASPCSSACPCLGLGAPARRPLPSSTLRAMLTRPQPSHQPGWRTPTSRYPHSPGLGQACGLEATEVNTQDQGHWVLKAGASGLEREEGGLLAATAARSWAASMAPSGGPLSHSPPLYLGYPTLISSFLLLALTLECLLSDSSIHLLFVS